MKIGEYITGTRNKEATARACHSLASNHWTLLTTKSPLNTFYAFCLHGCRLLVADNIESAAPTLRLRNNVALVVVAPDPFISTLRRNARRY